MKSGLPIKTIVVAGLAAALWVVPSLRTQGVGTIGGPLHHPDRVLQIEQNDAADKSVMERRLRRADASVSAVMPR